MPGRNTGELRFISEPQSSCAQTATPSMAVKTQRTSGAIDRAQCSVMEFLLIDHPLNYPVRDEDGECPLQNRALTEGHGKPRFIDVKRTFKKPLRPTSQILLGREYCVLCQRYARLGRETSGGVSMDLQGHGSGIAPTEHHYSMGEQVGGFDSTTLDSSDPKAKEASTSPLSSPYGTDTIVGSVDEDGASVTEYDVLDRAFASYFLGDVIQVCPVDAPAATSYHFRTRPFDLMSMASVTEYDASGSATRQDMRRGEVVRRMSGSDPEVNEERITDKDCFIFEQDRVDRLTTPLVCEDGKLVPTLWSDAPDHIHAGLEQVGSSMGFLPGGRLTFEDAWVWSKSTHTAVSPDLIDFCSRRSSEEERSFLASYVAGSGLETTYADLESTGQVLLVTLEPEDEYGAILLRLRKAIRKSGLKAMTVAPLTSAGSHKMKVRLLHAAPGSEPGVVDAIVAGGAYVDVAEALSGSIIPVGECAAQTPSLFSSVAALAEHTGIRLVWVPRRVGDHAAIGLGLLPGLFPFGHGLNETGAQPLDWGEFPGRGPDAEWMIEVVASDELQALVVGGVGIHDFDEPATARKVLKEVPFLVSLEVRASGITDHADVALSVAPVVEKNGTHTN